MDEKTEELRDIFMSVSEEETVTERQEETVGSLTDEGPGDEDLAEVIAAMRDRYEFSTGLDDGTLREVVSAFYEGADDEAIADAVGVDPETAFRARMDLHLVAEDDLDPAFDADAARDLLTAGADAPEADGSGADPATAAERLDADPDAVERFARAIEARNEALRANSRFRNRFEEILGDAALARRLASDVREDGLEEATEDMEVDVSF